MNLEKIYKHKHNLIKYLAYQYTRDVELAKDAAQDLYLTLIEQQERFDPRRGTFKGWLNSRIRYELLNARKRGKYKTHKLRTHWTGAKNVAILEATHEDYVEYASIDKYLEILKPKSRKYIEMVMKGYDYTDIALKCGVSRQAVSLCARNAIKKIRKSVENE